MPRRSLGQRGNAAIEFAIIGPAMVMILVFIFETGLQLMVAAMVDYGTRISARWGVTGAAAPGGLSPEAYIRATIVSASGGFLQSGRLSVTLQSYSNWANAGAGTGGIAGAGDGGTVVSYAVSYVQPVMTPPAAAVLGRNGFEHRSTLLVNNEPYPAR